MVLKGSKQVDMRGTQKKETRKVEIRDKSNMRQLYLNYNKNINF